MRPFRKPGCFYILVDLLGVVTLGHCLATLPQKEGAQAEPGAQAADEQPTSETQGPQPGQLPASEPAHPLTNALHTPTPAEGAFPLGAKAPWGSSPARLEARYGLGEARDLRPCLGEVLTVRPVQEPILGVPHGDAQAAFVRGDAEAGGLFEILVRSPAPMDAVQQTLKAELGPSEPGHAPGVRRWRRGASVTTLTTRGEHAVVRSFHEDREQAYRAARRRACGEEAP